jgi:DNA (cytosine-5)-methyltransferase 1
MTLSYASTFAGIGGFELGFQREGFTCTAQVEISPARLKILARHWPDVPKGGDIRDVNGSDLGRPTVLVGGFPCKDLSIGKAKRKGLAGEQSGLYWEFHRLVDEHLRLTEAAQPRFTVLENVPGLLRSNGGRDLAAVLLGLEQLGYGWAYRVVDARAVGSAQRRPRIIIVGHRGGDPRPAWRVLADAEHGGIALPLRGEPTGAERSGGGGSLAPDGVRFLRKSARPTKKVSEGGYATWVESDFFNVLNPNDAVYPPTKTRGPTMAQVKQSHLVEQGGRLRVLTPVEWERLQGFPDNWTAGVSAEERYYALGDAMNVDVARWLAQRLKAVHAEIPFITPHDAPIAEMAAAG